MKNNQSNNKNEIKKIHNTNKREKENIITIVVKKTEEKLQQ